jgi:hypothetical protein
VLPVTVWKAWALTLPFQGKSKAMNMREVSLNMAAKIKDFLKVGLSCPHRGMIFMEI